MHRNNKAFSLIELMVVIAIIGILASIAVPTYKDYPIRARVSEIFTLSSYDKIKISEYIAENGFPEDEADSRAMISALGPLNVEHSALVGHASFSKGLNSKGLVVNLNEGDFSDGNELVLIFQLNEESEHLFWRCGYGVDTTYGNDKYLPVDCRNQITL